MPVTGPIHHIDISIGHPDVSIPFYAAFFEALGYRRWRVEGPDWEGPNPRRATWGMALEGGLWFGFEVRPALPERADRGYDRYAPGPHHMAFHAASREVVDRVHAAMVAAGAEVLDPPADYTGQRGYSDGYYAVFFADPDAMKLEVVHTPQLNP